MTSLRSVVDPGVILSGVLLAACTDLDAGGHQRDGSIVHAIKRQAASFPELKNDPYFSAALRAIGSIRREQFVPAAQSGFAEEDTALPIGEGQTISSPSVVALMTAAARVNPRNRVLEVGTGSGFQAAVLSRLGAKVFTIEIVERLARDAALRLQRLGFANIEVRSGDGFDGWAEQGPFDAIIITAGATKVPQALFDQLRIGGRLVMPLGPVDMFEQIIVFEKTTRGIVKLCSLGRYSFVPLTGQGREPFSRSGDLDFGTPFCFGRQRELDLSAGGGG